MNAYKIWNILPSALRMCTGPDTIGDFVRQKARNK